MIKIRRKLGIFRGEKVKGNLLVQTLKGFFMLLRRDSFVVCFLIGKKGGGRKDLKIVSSKEVVNEKLSRG